MADLIVKISDVVELRRLYNKPKHDNFDNVDPSTYAPLYFQLQVGVDEVSFSRCTVRSFIDKLPAAGSCRVKLTMATHEPIIAEVLDG